MTQIDDEARATDARDPTPAGFTGRLRSAYFRRFKRNVAGVVGVVVVLVIALASYIGSHFAQDPNLVDLSSRFESSSSAHWLGTDGFGRDILARILEGGRVALEICVLGTVLALVVSMVLGVLVGYYGGVLDDILSRVFDVLSAFPQILLAVLVQIGVGKSLISVAVAIAVGFLPRYGRQWRVLTRSCRERDYVQAVQALGYSDLQIISRHIVPNVFTPVLLIAAGNMGRVVLIEASLSFIGAGVQVPNASWGNMIRDNYPYLQVHAMAVLYPGIVLSVLAIAFSFVGDALRDTFDLSE